MPKISYSPSTTYIQCMLARSWNVKAHTHHLYMCIHMMASSVTLGHAMPIAFQCVCHAHMHSHLSVHPMHGMRWWCTQVMHGNVSLHRDVYVCRNAVVCVRAAKTPWIGHHVIWSSWLAQSFHHYVCVVQQSLASIDMHRLYVMVWTTNLYVLTVLGVYVCT